MRVHIDIRYFEITQHRVRLSTSCCSSCVLLEGKLTHTITHHYVKNSNRRHGSETRAKAIVSDLEKTRLVCITEEQNWLGGG
jgi:hypothetical protein